MTFIATKPILYSYWRSSCSWQVRIALHVKGIDFDQRELNITDRQRTDELLNKISPFVLIPVLIDSDLMINESLAIIEYLDEKYPKLTTLLPGSIEDRAKIRALSMEMIANTQPLQNMIVLEHISDDPGKRAEWARHWIERSFAQLEKMLQLTARKYAYGDSLSLLDTCIPPQVYNARRFGVDMSKFPTIARLDAYLAEIPEFIKANALTNLIAAIVENKDVWVDAATDGSRKPLYIEGKLEKADLFDRSPITDTHFWETILCCGGNLIDKFIVSFPILCKQPKLPVYYWYPSLLFKELLLIARQTKYPDDMVDYIALYTANRSDVENPLEDDELMRQIGRKRIDHCEFDNQPQYGYEMSNLATGARFRFGWMNHDNGESSWFLQKIK